MTCSLDTPCQPCNHLASKKWLRRRQGAERQPLPTCEGPVPCPALPSPLQLDKEALQAAALSLLVERVQGMMQPALPAVVAAPQQLHDVRCPMLAPGMLAHSGAVARYALRGAGQLTTKKRYSGDAG